MKKIYLFLILVAYSGTNFAQCPTGLVDFSTQQQVNDFATSYPTCQQANDLIINLISSSITNVNGFINLTSVKGFNTYSATGLTNLDGLANLTYAGGVEISGTTGLSDLKDLTSLTQLGYLVINQTTWTTLLIPDNLERIEKFIVIANNPNLNNVSSLSSLPPVSGRVDIFQNPSLSSCAVEVICKGVEVIPGKIPEPTVNDNATGCNTINEIMAECASLPVRLISFRAQHEGVSVNLTWSTSFESNSSHFEIQRSQNGVTWLTLEKKLAQNMSNSTTIYTYQDHSPQGGNNYYRLKMVDLDRTYSYSSIQNVGLKKGSSKIYPNPVDDILFIQSIGGTFRKVLIYNSTGKAVLSAALPDKGLRIDKLPSGVYTAIIESSNGARTTQKFIKK